MEEKVKAGRQLNGFTSKTKDNFWRKLLWFTFFSHAFRYLGFSRHLRTAILRLNGAHIGRAVIIRRGVKIHFPWNLEIGNNCWIGEEVWFINHEKILIGSDVCISQRSIVCSGSHDYRSITLEYSHKPIEIKNGAWICLDSKVLPGVSIGECSVVSAGEIVRKSIPDYSILVDGEIRQIKQPK